MPAARLSAPEACFLLLVSYGPLARLELEVWETARRPIAISNRPEISTRCRAWRASHRRGLSARAVEVRAQRTTSEAPRHKSRAVEVLRAQADQLSQHIRGTN